jgi:hypothetical protein
MERYLPGQKNLDKIIADVVKRSIRREEMKGHDQEAFDILVLVVLEQKRRGLPVNRPE